MGPGGALVLLGGIRSSVLCMSVPGGALGGPLSTAVARAVAVATADVHQVGANHVHRLLADTLDRPKLREILRRGGRDAV
jgi:hypothetical protein